MVKEELTKFWKSSVSGSRSRKFMNDSLTLRDKAFSTIWLISPERVIGFLWKFYHRRIYGQDSFRYFFGGNSDPACGSGLWIRTRLCLTEVYAVSHCSCLINQSINQFISRHSTEARATVRLCRIKEKCLTTDLKCTRTTLDDRSFTAAGPHLWNNLPLHLRDFELSLSEFRRLLKTHLFGWRSRRLVTYF